MSSVVEKVTLEEAIKLHQMGKVAEAKEKYIEFLEEEKHPHAYCNLAIIYKNEKCSL